MSGRDLVRVKEGSARCRSIGYRFNGCSITLASVSILVLNLFRKIHLSVIACDLW